MPVQQCPTCDAHAAAVRHLQHAMGALHRAR